MAAEELSPQQRRLALKCPRCFFILGANKNAARAESYAGMPNLQAPIKKTAKAFAAQAGKKCTCGLDLQSEL